MKNKEIKGYKAFYKDCKNRYGKDFTAGETYSIKGPLVFGNNGNGYHFCSRLEDTLRYFPASEEEISIAEVTSLADTKEYYDDYNGFYDMYVARTIRIERFLSRKEIISMFLKLPDYRVIRFIQLFKLTDEEADLFRLYYPNSENIQKAIRYYHDGDKDVYTERYSNYQYQKRKDE